MIRLGIILLFVCIAQCLGKSLESANGNVLDRLKRSPHYECDYGRWPRWPPPPPPPYWPPPPRPPPPPPPPFWPPPPPPPPPPPSSWGSDRQAGFEQKEQIQQISDGGQSANLQASPAPASAPVPCDTCSKSSSAIGNAQSVNGDAVAVAIARSKGKR